MPRTRRMGAGAEIALVCLLAFLITIGLGAQSAAAKPTKPTRGDCRDGLVTANGCESPRAVSRHLERIVQKARTDFGLKAAIARVDAGRRTLLRTAIGRSQADVAANPRMHFRIGSMAIPWLTTIVLQLQDEGRLSLEDKLSRWYPNLPNADQITLRMLANSTSGYYDYIQGNEPFIDLLYANPFRRWLPRELLNTSLSRGLACEPGTCFIYSHSNYILLSRIVQRVTGRSTTSQMRRRILVPLGLEESRITPRATIPRPTLHAFTSDRGFYEDSTTWSPSWTIGSGTIATSTIDDIATAAPAIFSGTLLSRRAYREMVDPSTVGFPGFSDSAYYGLGLIAGNGWRLQNPNLNGYSGVLGYLTHGKITVAITTTNSPASAAADEAFSQMAFMRIAAYLAPAHRPPLGP